MSSSESGTSTEKYYKKKILLLGGLEQVKDKFQKEVSNTSLSLNNKTTIGVNISKVSYSRDLDYYLWNVSCELGKTFVRPMYYTGAEAVIIFISEDNIEQILQYYKEIISRLPVITLIFCIIVNNKSVREIKDAYFKTEKFANLFREKDFKVNTISDIEQIFSQISACFSTNLKEGKFSDNFIIDFIPLKSIVKSGNNVQYSCEEYIEPSEMATSPNRRLNTSILRTYLKQLPIQYKEEDSDWIIIKNKVFGKFSIFLRNGDVYFTPKNCLDCKNFTCRRKNRVNNFICIEANGEGWSNVRGICQRELLVLSKILFLNDAEENSLPKPILRQIRRMETCLKDKN